MKITLLILLTFFSGCSLLKPKLSPEQLKEQIQVVIANVQNKPDWLFPSDICPAEIMPGFEKDINYLSEGCTNNPQECFENCKKNDGNACYSLALLLQEQGGLEQTESESLFLRSCKLGVVSGCTNNAAFKLNLDAENVKNIKCAADTFEKTCAKDDAWGCTMYGFSLSQGKGREQNFDEALKALAKSCRHGDDDPACQNAKKLKEEIDRLRSEGQKK